MSGALTDPHDAVRWLRTPAAIRARCNLVFAAAERDQLAHFAYRPERLAGAAKIVADVTRAAYPTLAIPYHSRWRHFDVGDVARWANLAREIAAPPDELARIRFDLAVTSVLLDAGAGTTWRYRAADGAEYARSEGLAVASLDLFAAGAFSASGHDYRADAEGLARFDAAQLSRAFQVRPDNPLVGALGRALLMQKLGAALTADPELFGTPGRVGNLFDYLRGRAQAGRLPAAEILAALLRGLGPIWPGRIELGGVNLGDVWRHPAARSGDLTDGLVPFHKLSQWLAYSLVEPLEAAGIMVTDMDHLTGLPEYRNGGLFIDAGVLAPKHDKVLIQAHEVGSEVVVEWRALTLALLDRVADLVRAELGRPAAGLPLAKILQGGTWSAGRKLAAERRPGGAPPLQVISDGTVF